EDIFYYITLYNEPYSQPAEPADLNVDGLLKGLYLFKKSQASGGSAPQHRHSAGSMPRAQILVSGVTMPEGLRAQQLLADEWGVAADVWSVTSWGELRRDGIESERRALRDPGTDAPLPYVTQALSDAAGPFVAASDWMRAVADQIRQWVPGSYTTLGTDGFGFSDTRPAARRYFNVDAESIVVAVLSALAGEGTLDRSKAVEAATKYRIDDVRAAAVSYADTGSA
ncbi:transketolase-like TK C-terminal-containing protein, partial [Rhodococcus koreensis]